MHCFIIYFVFFTLVHDREVFTFFQYLNTQRYLMLSCLDQSPVGHRTKHVAIVLHGVPTELTTVVALT